MSKYINSLGTELSEVLERAASAQPAQFCGYWANIDFWLSELEHFVSIANGYEERLGAMRDAHDRFIAEKGGPHNVDEFDDPYQAARATTSRGERRRLVGRAKSAFMRIAQRAVEMGLIDSEAHDDLAQRVKLAEHHST